MCGRTQLCALGQRRDTDTAAGSNTATGRILGGIRKTVGARAREAVANTTAAHGVTTTLAALLGALAALATLLRVAATATTEARGSLHDRLRAADVRRDTAQTRTA